MDVPFFNTISVSDKSLYDLGDLNLVETWTVFKVFNTSTGSHQAVFPFRFCLSSPVIIPPSRPFPEKQFLRAGCKMKCSGSPDDYLPSYFQTFYQPRTWTQPAFYLAFWYFILFKGLKSFVFTSAMYVQFHFNLQLIHFLLDWNTWCILSVCFRHVNKFYLRGFQAVRHLWYTLSLELAAFVWVI